MLSMPLPPPRPLPRRHLLWQSDLGLGNQGAYREPILHNQVGGRLQCSAYRELVGGAASTQ